MLGVVHVSNRIKYHIVGEIWLGGGTKFVLVHESYKKSMEYISLVSFQRDFEISLEINDETKASLGRILTTSPDSLIQGNEISLSISSAQGRKEILVTCELCLSGVIK